MIASISLDDFVAALRSFNKELFRIRGEAIERCGAEYMPFWLCNAIQAAYDLGKDRGRIGDCPRLLGATEAANDAWQ